MCPLGPKEFKPSLPTSSGTAPQSRLLRSPRTWCSLLPRLGHVIPLASEGSEEGHLGCRLCIGTLSWEGRGLNCSICLNLCTQQSEVSQSCHGAAEAHPDKPARCCPGKQVLHARQLFEVATKSLSFISYIIAVTSQCHHQQVKCKQLKIHFRRSSILPSLC